MWRVWRDVRCACAWDLSAVAVVPFSGGCAQCVPRAVRTVCEFIDARCAVSRATVLVIRELSSRLGRISNRRWTRNVRKV